MNPSRRSVLLGLGAAALSGCAAPGSAVYQVVDSYRTLNRGKREYPVSRAQIDAQPLGVLGVQVEEGLKGLMLWQQQKDGLDYWRSGNDVALVMARGRIVSSQGFPLDQRGSRVVDGSDPLGSGLDPAREYGFGREIDFAAEPLKQLAQSQLRYRDRVRIELLGRVVEVDEWQETLRVSRRQRPWKQLWQLDAETGEVLRSIQHIGPDLRVILELLKAPEVAPPSG